MYTAVIKYFVIIQKMEKSSRATNGNGEAWMYGSMDAWKMTNSNGNYTPNNNKRQNGEALRHGNDKTTIIVKDLKILGSLILYSQRILRF